MAKQYKFDLRDAGARLSENILTITLPSFSINWPLFSPTTYEFFKDQGFSEAEVDTIADGVVDQIEVKQLQMWWEERRLEK